jgi:ligand-binding sensor domain-containing protein/class 3 adenylate cyclase
VNHSFFSPISPFFRSHKRRAWRLFYVYRCSLWFILGIVLNSALLLAQKQLLAQTHNQRSPQFLPSLSPTKLPSQYLYDSWTSESGSPTLPQDIAPIGITQTADGYIWIATSTGLLRFDGARFVVLDTTSTPGLHGNDIKTLYAARDGALWIGTGGNGLFRRWQGKFTQHISDTSEAYNFIRTVFQDSRGLVWAGTRNGALFLHESDAGAVSMPQRARGLPAVEISAIVEDKAHRIWVGTQQDGVYIIESSQTRHITVQDGLADEGITALAADSAGGVWIGTASLGLQRWADDGFTQYIRSANGLSSDVVSSILVDRAGTLWIGTSNGLNRYHNGVVSSLNTSNAGLSSNTVLALCEDYEGSIWIAAGGSGIDRIKDPKLTVFGKKEGLPYEIFSTILEDHSGRLWMGSFYNTGITTLHNGTVQHLDYATTKGGIPQGAFIRAMCEDSKGKMWFGTVGMGLIRYENGVFTNFKGNESLAQNHIRALYEDRKGRLWAGSFGGGLQRFEQGSTKNSGSLVTAFSTKNGLTSDYIFSIAEDEQNRLWLATRDGGVSIVAENGSVTEIRQKQGLPSNTALYVVADDAGTMWIGTQFGIALWREGAENAADKNTGTLKILSAKNGLPEEATRWMIQDKQGNYWLSGLSGMYCIPKRQITEFLAGERSTVEVMSYSKSDGMRSAECNGNNQPAACLDKDGNLWFPTMKGLVRVHPESIVRNTVPPPIVIEEVFANEKSLPLPHSLADGRMSDEALKLRAGTDRITIRYTALSLLFPDRVRFRYKLEGFDDDWIEAGKRREAYYTNLSPRLYTFRVQACNNDGVWNDVGVAMRFELMPKFYQTWWFAALCILAVLAIVVGFVQWRLRMAKMRERELAKLVEERTAEIQRQVKILDEQAREIEMNNTQLQEKNFQIEEERQKSDRLLLNILPPKIAQRLKVGEKIIADKFESVTVMFADIVGFTNMSARVPPEHLVENLSMVFTTFDHLAERHRLEKIKTIGDAYMLVGGLPEPMEDHAAQVARMALAGIRELQELTADLDEKIEVRVGIHTGAVVAGVIGMRKFAYDLWGDTVNTASRMESSGEPGRVHCTEEVYNLLKDMFDFEVRGEIEVKGKGMMRTYFIIGEK